MPRITSISASLFLDVISTLLRPAGSSDTSYIPPEQTSDVTDVYFLTQALFSDEPSLLDHFIASYQGSSVHEMKLLILDYVEFLFQLSENAEALFVHLIRDTDMLLTTPLYPLGSGTEATSTSGRGSSAYHFSYEFSEYVVNQLFTAMDVNYKVLLSKTRALTSLSVIYRIIAHAPCRSVVFARWRDYTLTKGSLLKSFFRLVSTTKAGVENISITPSEMNQFTSSLTAMLTDFVSQGEQGGQADPGGQEGQDSAGCRYDKLLVAFLLHNEVLPLLRDMCSFNNLWRIHNIDTNPFVACSSYSLDYIIAFASALRSLCKFYVCSRKLVEPLMLFAPFKENSLFKILYGFDGYAYIDGGPSDAPRGAPEAVPDVSLRFPLSPENSINAEAYRDMLVLVFADVAPAVTEALATNETLLFGCAIAATNLAYASSRMRYNDAEAIIHNVEAELESNDKMGPKKRDPKLLLGLKQRFVRFKDFASQLIHCSEVRSSLPPFMTSYLNLLALKYACDDGQSADIVCADIAFGAVGDSNAAGWRYAVKTLSSNMVGAVPPLLGFMNTCSFIVFYETLGSVGSIEELLYSNGHAGRVNAGVWTLLEYLARLYFVLTDRRQQDQVTESLTKILTPLINGELTFLASRQIMDLYVTGSLPAGLKDPLEPLAVQGSVCSVLGCIDDMAAEAKQKERLLGVLAGVLEIVYDSFRSDRSVFPKTLTCQHLILLYGLFSAYNRYVQSIQLSVVVWADNFLARSSFAHAFYKGFLGLSTNVVAMRGKTASSRAFEKSVTVVEAVCAYVDAHSDDILHFASDFAHFLSQRFGFELCSVKVDASHKPVVDFEDPALCQRHIGDLNFLTFSFAELGILCASCPDVAFFGANVSTVLRTVCNLIGAATRLHAIIVDVTSVPRMGPKIPRVFEMLLVPYRDAVAMASHALARFTAFMHADYRADLLEVLTSVVPTAGFADTLRASLEHVFEGRLSPQFVALVDEAAVDTSQESLLDELDPAGKFRCQLTYAPLKDPVVIPYSDLYVVERTVIESYIIKEGKNPLDKTEMTIADLADPPQAWMDEFRDFRKRLRERIRQKGSV